jgi:hypothetical protein
VAVSQLSRDATDKQCRQSVTKDAGLPRTATTAQYVTAPVAVSIISVANIYILLMLVEFVLQLHTRMGLLLEFNVRVL